MGDYPNDGHVWMSEHGHNEPRRQDIEALRTELLETRRALELWKMASPPYDELKERCEKAEAEMAAMRERFSRIAEKLQEKESYADLSGEEMLINAITTRALSGDGGKRALAVIEAAKTLVADAGQAGAPNYGHNLAKLANALKDLEGR